MVCRIHLKPFNVFVPADSSNDGDSGTIGTFETRNFPFAWYRVNATALPFVKITPESSTQLSDSAS